MEQLLKDKVAIVYGAGPIGSAIAESFAREGARLFLAAHSPGRIEKLAAKINQSGGNATATVVEVFDKAAVDSFVEKVVEETGRIDISFCATSMPGGGEQGAALSEMTYDDFALPITHYTKAQFITTNAAAKYMTRQGHGVLLMITAIASRIPIPYTAGFGPAWAAMEALSRTLAAELGPHGIRTVCLHSAGSPETQDSIKTTYSNNPHVEDRIKNWKFVNRNLLGKWPTLVEVGNMAAFMVSDKAGVTTAAIGNLTGGMVEE